MLKQSEQEYKEICTQVREASNAVMRYGSAAVALSTGAIGVILKVNGDSSNWTDGILFLILATVTVYVHLLINYKCSSHNRFVAYRNLITCEGLSKDHRGNIEDNPEIEDEFSEIIKAHKASTGGCELDDSSTQYVSFDFCMDHLNEVYAATTLDMNVFKYCRMLGEHAGVMHSKEPLDRERQVAIGFPDHITINFSDGVIWPKSPPRRTFISSTRAYFRLIWSLSTPRGTWSFPVFIASMLTYLVVLEFSLYAYKTGAPVVTHLIEHGLSGISFFSFEKTGAPYILIAIIINIILISIFFHILKKNLDFLINLMEDKKSIDSYFRQFMPFRLLYIDQISGGKMPFYLGSPWKDVPHDKRNSTKM